MGRPSSRLPLPTAALPPLKRGTQRAPLLPLLRRVLKARQRRRAVADARGAPPPRCTSPATPRAAGKTTTESLARPTARRCEELWLRGVALRHTVDEPRVDFSARLTRVMIETNAPDGRERLRGALTRHCSWSGWRPAPPCSNASR